MLINNTKSIELKDVICITKNYKLDYTQLAIEYRQNRNLLVARMNEKSKMAASNQKKVKHNVYISKIIMTISKF